ncbi:MAG: hypothetical protein ABUT39_23965 [Acidobacteriota bacterium]
MSRTARSIFALLALALFLATGTAHALPSANGPGPERASGTLSAVWDWLASVLDAKDVFVSIFDASTEGAPVPNPDPPRNGVHTDVGGFIDPNGGW